MKMTGVFSDKYVMAAVHLEGVQVLCLMGLSKSICAIAAVVN